MPRRKRTLVTPSGPPNKPEVHAELAGPLVKLVPTKGKGAPHIEITDAGWAQVERMATALCTADEIADYLGISRKTLYSGAIKERFQAVQRMKAAASKLEVRERQLDKAKSGNPVDSIWFGKQHLGQTDRQAVTGADGGPLEIALASIDDMRALLDKLKRKAEKQQ